ncbi:MAG TPA: aminopeptidase [Ktedonobacterales bacterium]
MDARISRWAKTLVNYCLEVQPGQLVWLIATPAAEELIAEVHREVLRAGGDTVPQLRLESLEAITLSEGSEAQLTRENPVSKLLAETADARLFIESETNTRLLSTVDPARQALALQSSREARQISGRRSVAGEMRWCLTLFPTGAYASEADMSLEDFREFVYEACFLNSEDPAERWRELGRQQQFYVDWLAGKREVHVIGPDTDLHVNIEGRIFRNSDGKRNFPSGEFFTSPVEDSAEGHIRFTIPSVVRGHLVSDIRLEFEHGRVVQSSATEGQDYLRQMLALDDGASLVGEFAFGNNFGITRGIKNILFDEKLGGTIHMALGNSYAECGGKNSSALHWDMICDLREAAGGGEVYVDGTLFLKDGKLVVKP